MIILVLNCGSSSIKYQLFDVVGTTDPKVIAKGLLERIGIRDSLLTHKLTDDQKFKIVKDIPDHTIGINLILETLTSKEYGVISNINEIKAVGHRVAHGGENFKESVLITDEVKKGIEECIELAPLHNPANLKGIMSMENLIPGIPQVAVFDTSFHQSMPETTYLYAIPYMYYEKYKIRKYGFHGTSHKFVAKKACKILGKNIKDLKIITCHLGNGASVAAIKGGVSMDTSMGFTPVDGLIMGTRCGDIDPGVLLFLAEKENINLKGVNDLINKESGVKGISSLSSDMRDIEIAAENGNAKAQLALDMYVYRIIKFVGAYMGAMGGIDLIIFTGGVGENDHVTRAKVSKQFAFLGLEFDDEINYGLKGTDKVLTKENSKVTVMTITTNEELVIATETKIIIEKCI